MIKFSIIIGQKYFSNYVAQSNYLIIKTKFLIALFKNNIETKEYNLLKHRNNFFLKETLLKLNGTQKKIYYLNTTFGKVNFAGKSFDSFVKLVSRFSQCLKYAYIVYILFFLYLVWFFCFDELLNRGILRTISKIQDGTFCENS